MTLPAAIQVIDSHTEGEPTRVVIEGGPSLSGDLRQQRDQFREQFDHYRSAIVNEPRGADAVVGALLCPPERPDSTCGVIFFNNVGYLGMCGHGTIGLVATLAHLGRVSPGRISIDTPVGTVAATLNQDGSVTVENVLSYRYLHDVEVAVEGLGTVKGDVAYGGNWFFLTTLPIQLTTSNLEPLSRATTAIMRALREQGITGENGAEIDHVEVFADPQRPDAHSKNYVLCPGCAYDRSPCGTGLSAKLACLAADGKLAPGQPWRQESIIGSLFEGRYQSAENGILPHITGRAYITAVSQLIFEPQDPFAAGIRL